MTIRARVEDGVLELLAPLLVSAGGYVRTLAVYSGDTTPDGDDADVARLTQGSLPGILVATGDGQFDDVTMGRISTLVFDVEILVVTANLRSKEAANRGDGQSRDPGAYQIIRDIRRRLFRRPLTVGGVAVEGAGTLRPVSERSVLRSSARQIWLTTYTIRVDGVDEPLSDELGDYTTIGTGMNFPEDDPGAPANPVIEASVTP